MAPSDLRAGERGLNLGRCECALLDERQRPQMSPEPAGSISSIGYTLHCIGDSVPFGALWYGGTIALCTRAGVKLGPRLPRW